MLEDYYKKKNIRYLILGIIIVSLIILTREIILKPQPLVIPEILPSFPKVEIDFKLLESPEIEELSLFEEISFPEEIGRENPFEPY